MKLTRGQGELVPLPWAWARSRGARLAYVAATTVEIQTSTPARGINPRFLSVTIDASLVRHHFAPLNFSDPNTLSLAKALAPAILRIGGTSADAMTCAYLCSLAEMPRDRPSWAHQAAILQRHQREQQLLTSYCLVCADAVRGYDMKPDEDSPFTMAIQDWDHINTLCIK